MNLTLFNREVGKPTQRTTAQRQLSTGTAAPKALGRLGNTLEKMGTEVALKVKAASETMEYSNIISSGKVKTADFYAERSLDVENHDSLVDDTEAFFKELRAELTQGVSDPLQKARINQGLDQVGVSFQRQAINDSTKQAIVKVRADHVKSKELKLQEAAIGSDAALIAIVSEYNEETRGLAQSGIYNADAVEEEILSFSKDAVYAKSLFMINDNPWNAKDYLKNKKTASNLLDPATRANLIGRAQTQINIRENRVKTQQKAEIRAIEKANKTEVSATVKQLERGIVPSNYDELVITVKGTDLEKDLKEAHAISDDITLFNGMNPDEKQTFINMAKKSGRITGVQAERIDILEKNLDRTTTALKNGNGLELAFEQGVINGLPPLAYDTPEVLAQRKQLALMASEHYGQPVAPITTGEANRLIGELDLMMVTDRAKRLGDMVNAWGEMALPAFEQIAKKEGGIYAISGALISEGRADTAIGVMNGMMSIKANPKIIPTDFIHTYDAVVGDAYADNPEQSVYIRDAVRALYAQSSINAGTTIVETADEGDIEDVVNAITGGIYELDIETFGLNDTYKIEAPRHGVEQDDFEDWLEGITPQNIEMMGGTANDEDVARRINEGKIKLLSLGNGHYGVEMIDGRPIVANDGRGFILRYPEQ